MEEKILSACGLSVAELPDSNQLATHLPDRVVYIGANKEQPFQTTFQAVVMFLDISGFTALCEKYSLNAKYGTDQLSKTLNGYMEALVRAILTNDGDIIKFAGDAILTLWPVKNYVMMQTTVSHVIKCAVDIQKKYGEWTTSVGVKLRVKIGIAAGEVSICYLGNNEFCHYVTMGRAVEAVNLAEKFCVSGDTVVSPSAWCHCAVMESEHIILDDGKHVKVLDVIKSTALDYHPTHTLEITPDLPSKASSSDTEQPIDTEVNETSFDAMPSSLHVPGKSRRFSVLSSLSGKSSGSLPRTASITDTIRVRRAVLDALPDSLAKSLSLYIAPPVLRKMEEHQPLEYLSEMRQVTIVFINLALVECTKLELCSVLQSAFKIIYANVKQMQGCMNKIFMFDKGSTFLVIFGLPGYKHENDCAHALKCAHQMKEDLGQVTKIERASIGVTTGSTFCGVVGHPHRHEYTVIGRKVNMAARLMMYYPGKVTCDSETFHHSKLHKGNFANLELLEMKGLKNVGTIREFKPSASGKDTTEAIIRHELLHPLIGRDDQMQQFKKELNRLQSDSSTYRFVISIEGEAGTGRTRILDAIIVYGLLRQCRMVSCGLTINDAKTPYYAIKFLLMDLLELTYDMPHQQREHHLYQMFRDPFILDNMAILNDIMQLKLPQKAQNGDMDSDKRKALLREVLEHLMHEYTKSKGFVIFTVDDAHLMDPESWEFIQVLGIDMNSLVVMTMRMPLANLCPAATSIYNHHLTMKIQLPGVEPKYLASLACQLLGVSCIPQRLEMILQEKSQGMPSWCEQLLQEMLYKDEIEIKPKSMKHSSERMIYSLPVGDYLVGDGSGAETSKDEWKSILEQYGISMDDLGLSCSNLICEMARDDKIDSSLPGSIRGMIQAKIDRMEEFDQMIIKTASILGVVFPREMLHRILQIQVSSEKVGASLQRLSEAGVFSCGASAHIYMKNKKHSLSQITTLMGGKSVCSCHEGQERPMKDCEWLMFQSGSTQETAYDIFLENTRKSLHVSAAQFLESQAHKCTACGGGSFVTQLALAAAKPHTKNKELQEKRFRKTSFGLRGRARHGTLSFKGKSGATFKQTPSRNEQDVPKREKRLSLAKEETSTSEPNNNDSGLEVEMNALLEDIIFCSWLQRIFTALELFKSQQLISLRAFIIFFLQKVIFNEVSKDEEENNDELDTTYYDMRECECMSILSSVYPQLVFHWRRGGNIQRTIHFLIEAAAAAIATHDNMQALSYLQEVRIILEAVKEARNPFEGDVAMTDLYVYDVWDASRMESLTGQAYFHMCQTAEAMPHFHEALTLLGSAQPTTASRTHWVLIKELIKQWKHSKWPAEYLGKGSTDRMGSERLVEKARCLSHIVHEYLVKGQKTKALMTALQQLNMAEQADTDLHELIIAYVTIHECWQSLNHPSLALKYQHKAQCRCIVAMNDLTPDNLHTIAHLYCSSVNMRLAFGHINDAIDAGYMAARLIDLLHDNDMRIQTLPLFSQALLLASRIVEAVDILTKLEYTVTETNDVVAKAWYYACCMDIILEAGFQFESCQRCLDFGLEAKQAHIFKLERLPFHYLAACITLWYQRKGQRNSMELWRQLAVDTEPEGEINNSYMGLHAFVKLLESQLIGLSRLMINKQGNKVEILAQNTAIKRDLAKLKKSCKTMKALYPRFLHLSAYYAIINKQTSKAARLVGRCLSVATDTENLQEVQWCNHNNVLWFTEARQKQDELWAESPQTKLLDWHKANQVEGSVIKYSLPLPAWF